VKKQDALVVYMIEHLGEWETLQRLAGALTPADLNTLALEVAVEFDSEEQDGEVA
jgi:hypothetical protein